MVIPLELFTMLFLQSIFVFGEPLDPIMLYAFVMIWTAIALYALSLWRSETP